MRVLVVDDQAANIFLTNEVLGGELQLFAATSGEQALALCARNPPDLVLLDVAMPAMDGLETCRRLKHDLATCGIPVIFVTAGGGSEAEDACWNAGAVDFISKPINPITLRNRVRAHLTLKQQSDQLRQLALVDPLTGLANRRHFDQRLATECRRARRGGAPLSVFMFDVDHFKRYNDRYGHPAGDACLAAIADVLRASVARPADLVARYGGEEFICLLPETDLAGALHVAESAAAELRRQAIAHADSQCSAIVSASIGVATATDSAAGSSDDGLCADLVSLADDRLYHAKRTGRDRVCGATLGQAVPRTLTQ